MTESPRQVSFRPTDPEFLADPYPTYARLRREAPIFFHRPWGKWILTRHRDVDSLLRDRRLGRVIPPGPADDGPGPRGRAPRDPALAPFHAIQEGICVEF
jgi:cytochrome P450